MKQKKTKIMSARRIGPIILTIEAPIAGFIFLYLLELFLNVEFSKQLSAIVNFVIVGFIASLVFPRLLGIPFGRINTRVFFRKTGFYLPKNAWKHVILWLSLVDGWSRMHYHKMFC